MNDWQVGFMTEAKRTDVNCDTGGGVLHSLQTGERASHVTGRGSNVHTGKGDINVGQQTFSIQIKLPENVEASRAAVSQIFEEFNQLVTEKPNVNLVLSDTLTKEIEQS